MIHIGDCLKVMRGMADNSVDAVVTDPPYGLSFMGKRWDYDVPSTEIWAECLRLMKPGGHLLAFAGTRTQHRMAARIEDAGFEIRDMIAWVYGSGFPKSHNGPWGGTALKPALEPITVARKPLAGTVEANWREHGTGALNIDACRVDLGGAANPSIARRQGAINHLSTRKAAEAEAEGRLESRQSEGAYRAEREGEALGRWPANLIHDGSDEVLAAFPAAPGQKADLSDDGESARFSTVYEGGPLPRGGEASSNSVNNGAVGFKVRPGARRLDSGSAARFFYCAKATREDRNDGLDSGPVPAVSANATMRDRETANWPERNGNHHPTVKPTDLMRYLCRLVTPAGGMVLDPFMGSGSTGKAAVLEGFQFIGIELDPAYAAIAEARIRVAQPGLSFGDVA
ncbi:DNA-methyltransferase [Stenotrophomonas maltophilia]|uniref:DNA-methyltransferase n=1 Tax=Stenotrophomonas maltophilia TaxID=40324 RepID=UPI000C1617DF|nr:site-specific DNA-methyltransferase [Stenotrophomonas maltophilia]